MSATQTSPESRGPSPVSKPGFGRPMVTVTEAVTQTPGTAPVSASRPEGTSTETTRRPASPIALIHSATGPSGARVSPVPSTASTSSGAPPNRAAGKAAMGTPSAVSARACSAAAPESASASVQATPASRPQRCRCRAAASPSPPLLPFPQMTYARSRQWRATCHPAASISQLTGTWKRSEASLSTSRAWALRRLGSTAEGSGALYDEGAVRVAAVDRVALGDWGVQELDQELGRDRAHLWELERGVPKGAVVDGDAEPLIGLLGLGQRAGAPDPGHHPLELVLETEPLEVLLHGMGVALGDPLEDLVQHFRPPYLLEFGQDHGGELAVPL